MAQQDGNGTEPRPIHAEVLAAAQRLCSPEDWTFRPVDVVRALPHMNESSVRTHIVSRCCVNAPANHPHRWPYFRRVGRGLYEILPALHLDDEELSRAGLTPAPRLVVNYETSAFTA